MKQRPFCGTKWKGNGPCPGCGVKPETSQDDSMFRPPEEGKRSVKESSPEFKVEELLRWEPSQDDSPEAGEEASKEEESMPKEEEEGTRPLKKPWKRWQKLATAAVAVVVAVALVVRLWPQTPILPQVPAFFVQGDTLMALPVNGEPQKVTEYTLHIEDSLQVSPDQKSMAWSESGGSIVKLLPADGEEVKAWENRYASSPFFSQDGKYLYLSMEDEKTGDSALWQYDMDSGEEKEIGAGSSYNCMENGTLLAVFDGTNLTVYDSNTAEEKWSQEADVRWMNFFDDCLYFAVVGEETSQFCCWQDGQVEVLLENLDCLYTQEDRSLYLQCYQEETFPAAELMKDDVYSETEKMMLQRLENMTVHSPERSLYYFDGSTLHSLGENRRLYFFPEREQAAMVCSVESSSFEEIKGTLGLLETYDMLSSSGLYDPLIKMQLESQWPCEISQSYVAVGEKLFLLPEDAPQNPYQMRVAGDWVCFYAEEESGLWLGKMEGEKVVFQNFFSAQNLINFMVTAEGNVYYWSGDTTGTLFENGLPVATQVHLNSLQYTDDGAIYFLNGPSSFAFTLNRLYQGKQQRLAENVKEFTAYTRDYVVFLQYGEGEGEKLFTCIVGKKPVLAAEQVDSLLPSIEKDTSDFSFSIAHNTMAAGINIMGNQGYIMMTV